MMSNSGRYFDVVALINSDGEAKELLSLWPHRLLKPDCSV